jgi:hypothetical protein
MDQGTKLQKETLLQHNLAQKPRNSQTIKDIQDTFEPYLLFFRASFQWLPDQPTHILPKIKS